MDKVNKLSLSIKKLDAEIKTCSKCGICQSVCPLYCETRFEPDSARGKLSILDGIIDNILENPQNILDRLNRCLLCGSCENICPRGVNTIEIFFKARALIHDYIGLSAIEKIIFKKIIGKPTFFNSLINTGSKIQKFLLFKKNNYYGTCGNRFIPNVLSDRSILPISSQSVQDSISSKGYNFKTDAKVAFFIGCLIDKIFPNIAHKTLDVLNHFGIDVYIPQAQGCCGIPALSSGDIDTFKKLVLYNVELFEKVNFKYLISSCSTCSFVIKKLWPKMFGSQNMKLTNKIESISKKVIDINQFIVSNFSITEPDLKKLSNRPLITYHDPCHLRKSMGIYKEPRQLISASSKYLFKEMEESSRCCGLGGSFNLNHYEFSVNIGKKKIDNIIASGCQTVATSCPACMIQLFDIFSKTTENIAIKHTIEIYGESINQGDNE
ncbi:MAG: (Fe-S)-binding protein [Desulfobacterales bacterium]|nr:(Fe-S)-binding protein [Desulfobacterales bacterium]